MVVAAFTEEPMMNNAVDIQLIEKRITVLEVKSAIMGGCRKRGTPNYLRYRSSEDNHLIKLANTLHEVVHTWSFYHVDVVVLTFNLNWNRKVRLMQNLT